MGTRIQFYSKIIFGLFISLSCYAQAPKTTDSITVVHDRYGNTRYSITPFKLTEFYIAQRNLQEVSIALGKLKLEYDSLETKTALIDSNYKAQIDTLKNAEKNLKESLTLCTKTNNDLDKANGILHQDNLRLKHRQKTIYCLGVATPIVITITTIIIKSVYFKQ